MWDIAPYDIKSVENVILLFGQKMKGHFPRKNILKDDIPVLPADIYPRKSDIVLGMKMKIDFPVKYDIHLD